MMDVYDSWKGYRKVITEYISSNCDKGGSVVIYGAGQCGDIELTELVRHFDKVVLMDRDVNAMQAAIDYYSKKSIKKHPGLMKDHEINLLSKIGTVKSDFVGIDSNDFAKTSQYCGENLAGAIKRGNLECFEQCFYSLIESIYEKNRNYELSFPGEKYDYGVVIGTHSQLNNNFSAQWHVIRQMLQSTLKISPEDKGNVLIKWFDRIAAGIENIQRSHTGYIVERFNNAVMESVDSRLIVGLETGNTGVGNSIIDGAYNAILDFERRKAEEKMSVDSQYKLVWPFDIQRGISYDVLLMRCMIVK